MLYKKICDFYFDIYYFLWQNGSKWSTICLRLSIQTQPHFNHKRLQNKMPWPKIGLELRLYVLVSFWVFVKIDSCRDLCLFPCIKLVDSVVTSSEHEPSWHSQTCNYMPPNQSQNEHIWNKSKRCQNSKETKKKGGKKEVELTLAQCDSSRSLCLGQRKKSERLSLW